MKTLVVDFETRWDSKEYTLSKLTTEENIRSPKFKAFGLGWKWFVKIKRMGHARRHTRLGKFNRLGKHQRLAHNAQFDVSILAWQTARAPSSY